MSDYKAHYVLDGQPEPGDFIEIRPSIFWLRMPLPFKLDHINLWVLDDGDTWTVVDTGFSTDETKQFWLDVFKKLPGDKNVGRLIVTHFHPDHIGLAGWFQEQFGTELWMSHGEWTMGRMLSLDTPENLSNAFHEFYKHAGFDDDQLNLSKQRQGRYGQVISPIPAVFNRLVAGDTVIIGTRKWQLVLGTGHSPEHICLYSADDKILISGDQVLPRISPNVSVWPQEPLGDPLKLFINSLKGYFELAPDTLVLPSHDWPFDNMHDRLNDLIEHHQDRLDETLNALSDGKTAIQVMNILFTRKLDDHQLFFAVGETIAHLHRLEQLGKISRSVRSEVTYFNRL